MSDTSMPLVSVVIPVYNSMPYLTATLESLLAQDLTDFEVIAIDDGSSDGSGEELDRFAERDARLTVIHQPNSGWPGMPRNRGLELARGEFVLFMDSDDTVAPQALSSMVAMAEDRDADVVIPRFAGTGGRGVQSLFLRHPHGEITLARAMETLSPQKLFRREMIERDGLRFPEGRVRLEDGIFVTRAYTIARQIVFCGREPLYFIHKRDDGQNISSQAIEPAGYVDSCRRIARLLMDGVPDQDRARVLVRQFFTRKGLRFYAPQRWLRMDSERRREWVALHRAFLEEFVPPELAAGTAHPTDRRKMERIRAADVAGLDALIGAEHGLEHSPRHLAARGLAGGGVELTVQLTPARDAALLRGAPLPSRAAQRMAAGLARALRPAMRWRAVRGAVRRAFTALSPGAPRAYLYAAGRKTGRGIAVPGRLSGVDPASGSLSYDFALTPALLRRFGTDRVDLWTIAEVEGMSGRLTRVESAAQLSKRVWTLRVYATNQGNVSLDLAPKKRPAS
ncbi:glycosyltransferase family 2 protein [Leucobacter massiliensis]|uniref:Cell wall biosynthesis glycosyltransferase n=1 Tax=Leucobacter massiliensis TaxID=1686285 RepID=A0A2S9QQB1_9MICO|nr:glycosyltransferase family A protein [Leucobacter massiliensis]PRI11779.1 cell wall biosynthesis glycosyltransferase [Leucobacter massiliensis]